MTSAHVTSAARRLLSQDVLNGTDSAAVLQLTNLVQGRYFFTLEVEDEEGLTSTDSASLVVNPGATSADSAAQSKTADSASQSKTAASASQS